LTNRISILLLAAVIAVSTSALAHGGHAHIKGIVDSVGEKQLTVTTTDGKTVAVPLTAQTKYFSGEAACDLNQVRKGQRVVVHLGGDGAAAEVHLPAK
jgi:hypothetical protein